MIALPPGTRPDLQPDTGSRPGLRERKKVKTRAAIQHQALRLFRLRAYQATTVEQITQAVEVSPSTVFRDFPATEDLVFPDDCATVIIAAIRTKPPDAGPVRGVCATWIQPGTALWYRP